MSIYGCALFEREHEKVLRGMRYQDDHDIFVDWDFPIRDLKYDVSAYNKAKKPSRKVCRLRNVFHDLAYNYYHYYSDDPCAPDREQRYHFGKMEIFV